MIERVLLDLYTALLRLYPRQFRQDFAAEMQTVFGDALGCAHREGLWLYSGCACEKHASCPMPWYANTGSQ